MVIVRPMVEQDVAVARSIFSLAFGTFVGAPDPASFGADRDYISTRRNADPGAAFVAEVAGEVVGSNFATHWGSVGFFGPLTIRPDMWNQGLGRHLMTPIVDCFDHWNLTLAGLHTFAHSTKHVHLYQQYGFWPRFLSTILSKPVTQPESPPTYSLFSELSADEREASLAECFELTDSIYPELSLDLEIRSVFNQELGDTVLIREAGDLLGLAVCHCGPGTEAGKGNCYIKFGAARPGTHATAWFGRLIDACEVMARGHGLSYLVAGVNLARQEAYTSLLDRGFKAVIQGLAMHRGNEPGYSRPDVLVLDDWR